MQSLTTALNELGSVQKSDGLNSAVNALRKIPDIIDSLDDSKLSRFATQMNKVAASIHPLATEMQKSIQWIFGVPHPYSKDNIK